ncbi:hypothetical protein LCGC14_2546640, partial [marine sediment metagenome]
MTEMAFAEMSFEEILDWSRDQGMTSDELDERAIIACLQNCKIYGKCANVQQKDWCDNACVSAI